MVKSTHSLMSVVYECMSEGSGVVVEVVAMDSPRGG